MGEIRLLSVSPGDIHPGSLDFSIRYRLEESALEERIRQTQWVSPLTGIQVQEGFIVIDGFRRWRILQELGWHRLPFLCLSKSILEKELFFLSVALQGSTALKDLDRCLAIRKARERFAVSEEEMLEWVMPSVGLPRSLKVLRDYDRVSLIEPEIQALIDRGEIPFKVAEELAQSKAGDRLALVRTLLPVCSFHQNEFLTVIESLRDLALKEGKNVDQVLQRDEMTEILEHDGWDRRERAKQFMNVLHRLRFPSLSQWEKKFEELARQVQVGDELTLEKAPYFEGESVEVHLKIRSYEHLVSVLGQLEKKKALFRDFPPSCI